ncbi:amidohydrolase family protein [Ottowia sp.]|uniref:amidohydrolase family protein n=1 Tax=Ottowia sp. TaxID=1898956 RepID=UPI002C7E1177|nr:amidohydrolase family protein [Ottowia sp.]HOB65577.1 amidohydrolase family protein [Ottowia sp.]HPZ56614.1 amidohydrolase family protein [Ottowia sp.]HQD46679.1 amidohydrolase family protein [Ottowia sp.]
MTHADQPVRIDTHQHIVPPTYAAWLAARGLNAGGRAIPHWSVDGAQELMHGAGIASAILSVSTPGVHLGDDTEARDKAREVNEFAASVMRHDPARFGYFATLTLPHVAGAIAEAEHALDHLGADGVVLLANVNGTYLGDPAWEPLMAALNARQAVVFVHPSSLPTPPVPGIAPFVADFLLDTTRAAINLARTGCLERYPDLKIILSHAGGFVPFAAERMARACSDSGEDTAQGLARLRRFYFDLALSSSPYALPSLLAFADPARITYGSDWPFAPHARSLHFARLLDEYALTPAQRHAIDRGNAEKLFPRLARAGG